MTTSPCNTAATGGDRPHARIDLRGKTCPMTFVYTKLELERLQSGDILEVRLDYPPSFTTIPRSVLVQALGETIYEYAPAPGEKALWIRKT
jgi:TusA-related sulfurtransferase